MFENLLSPLLVNGVIFKDRIVMLPMGVNYASPNAYDRGIRSCAHCLLHLNHSGHFVLYKQPLQFLGVIFFFFHNGIIIRWS